MVGRMGIIQYVSFITNQVYVSVEKVIYIVIRLGTFHSQDAHVEEYVLLWQD